MIMLILRHAWLNLWDKHMTTGRINQVSKNQNFTTNVGNLESSNEFTFAFLTWCKGIDAKNSIFTTDAAKLGDHRSQRPKPSNQQNWHCNKRISIRYNPMRLIEFIKSTNTNSQTLRNSEESQVCSICMLKSAMLADPKEETAAAQPIQILFQCKDLR